MNLSGELRQILKKQKCFVFPGPPPEGDTGGPVYLPDIQVVCGEPLFADDQKDMLTNPSLIVEILSKSTEAHDRGFKFGQRREIESLQEYFLVSQQEPRVERYLRQPGDQWLLTESAGLDGSFRSEILACFDSARRSLRQSGICAETSPL